MKLIYSSSAINSWALWWFLLLPRPVRNLPGPEPRSLAWKCSKPKMSSTPMKLEGLAPVPQQNAEHRKTGAELDIWNPHQQKKSLQAVPMELCFGWQTVDVQKFSVLHTLPPRLAAKDSLIRKTT